MKQLVSQDLLAREHIEAFVREVHLLERLRPHPNVVLFLGVVPPPNLALVTCVLLLLDSFLLLSLLTF